MDAPRDFLIFYFFIFIFSPNEQRARGGGRGVRCQTFSFSFFPCSADHERDWPPCKVVFFGLATNALNVRNNNNNNIYVRGIYICIASSVAASSNAHSCRLEELFGRGGLGALPE